MSLHPVSDAMLLPNGALTSTGHCPILELRSSRGTLPSSWCWFDIVLRDGVGELRPVLRAHGDAGRANFDLPVVQAGRTRVLLLLPERTRRLEIAAQTAAGAIPPMRVSIGETGKLRLFADFLLRNPAEVWAVWRDKRSLDELKVELVRREGRRTRPSLETWFHHYLRDVPGADLASRGTGSVTVVLLASGAETADADAARRSVLAQTYPHWYLLQLADFQGPNFGAGLDVDPRIRHLVSRQGQAPTIDTVLIAAQSRLLLFMNASDRLLPHALARLADAETVEGSDVIFADVMDIDPDTGAATRLHARSAFSHDQLMSSGDMPGPWALRSDLGLRLDGCSLDAGNRASLDILLRALEQARQVTHVPDVLSERVTGRVSPQMIPAETRVGLKAAHLQRLGFSAAAVVPRADGLGDAARYHAAPAGRILTVIPTKNRGDILRQCVETVRATTHGLDLDIVVVDHESTEPGVLGYFDELRATGAATVIPYSGPFNYSAINNSAVRRCMAGHDLILFLNNDIEARHAGWLDAMVDLAMRADVGAVGATLLYPDGRVQHAGVVVGLQGHAEHAYKFEPVAELASTGALETRDFSAVTGACLLMSATAFQAVGGFDEDLAVGFNDVDLCLRVRQRDLRVLHCADAVLLHHESVSRGYMVGDPHPNDSRLFESRWKSVLETGDPFFSPLLDRGDYAFAPARGQRVPETAAIRYRTTRLVRPVPAGLATPRETASNDPSVLHAS